MKPFDPETLLETVRSVFASAITRVLVVEDDPDSQRLLRTTLERQGLTVAMASNGAEGLERLSEHLPDAIVLDLGMPVMDGLEFLDRLKVEPGCAEIAVVILTGASLDQDDLLRLASRCSAALTKGLADTVTLVKAITAPRRRNPIMVRRRHPRPTFLPRRRVVHPPTPSLQQRP